MVKYIYSKVLDVLGQKPFKLWGMSLLASLITFLACVLCFGLPIVGLAASFVISVGMAMIYLAGYRGQDFNSDELFMGFKDFGRVAGGMAWMALWILIWSMIPVVGPIFGIIKMYSYRFTPYILATNKEVSATQALRLSIAKTNGFKGKMFGADLIPAAFLCVVAIVFGLLSLIPAIGGFFSVVLVIIILIFSIICPLVYGLVSAGFYDEIESGVNPQKYANLEMEKAMRKQAQMQAQMQAYQQQQAQMQAQMQAQQAAYQAQLQAQQAPPAAPKK